MKAARKGFTTFSLHARGFTLIELLVTMVIITILAGIGFYLFSEAKATGRDSKRKTDLTYIANALELYYQANRVYPGTAGVWYSSLGADPWIAGTPNLVPNYINALPKDPIQSSTYRYVYLSLPQTFGDPDIPSCPTLSNGQYFILGAYLESRSDKDSIGTKVVKECKGNPVKTYLPFNSSNNWYVLTTP